MDNDDFLRELGLTSVVTRMKRVSDAMLHDGKRLYKQLGMDIEPNWFAVFRLLQKHESLTITEIADQIGLSHPSVISIVNKMIKAGYLVEARSSDDNRRRNVSLTERARQKIGDFEYVWDAGTTGFKRMMNDVDVLGFLDLLETRIGERGFKTRTLEQLERQQSVTVVPYTEKYRKEFASLNYDWIGRYYTIEEHDHEQLDDPRASVIGPGGEIFFAVVDGQAVGTVALINMDDNAFELAKMAVSPDFQGYKIGERLMRACVDEARRSGKQSIVLESNTRQFAAINLYRKFGFKETPPDPNTAYTRSNIRMELKLREMENFEFDLR